MKASARPRQKPSSSTFPVFVQVRRRSNCSSIFVFGDERFAGVNGAFGPVTALGSPSLVIGLGLGVKDCSGEPSIGSGFVGAVATGDTTPVGAVRPQLLNTPSGTPAHSPAASPAIGKPPSPHHATVILSRSRCSSGALSINS